MKVKLKDQLAVVNEALGKLSAQYDELAAKYNRSALENEKLQKQLIDQQIESSKGMADKFKVGQLDKQLRVIDHITAGRTTEAIQEILTPLPVLFTMDVRFADDKTRIAAEDETFERLKKVLQEAVGGITIKREPKKET